MPPITRSRRRLTIHRVAGSTASCRLGIDASAARASASAIRNVIRIEIGAPPPPDDVAVASTARSDGSLAGVIGGRAADAPSTPPVSGSAATEGWLFFFFAFGFARTTAFALGAGLIGRWTLGCEGVGDPPFDGDCEDDLDDVDGAAGRWTGLGVGFDFCGTAADGGSGAGSGAGDGSEGSVTTGSVGEGSSWAKAAGGNADRAIRAAVIESASRLALLLRTGSRPLPSHSHVPCVGGVFNLQTPSSAAQNSCVVPGLEGDRAASENGRPTTRRFGAS